jgi:transposase
LAAQIHQGQLPAIPGVVRWRLCNIVQWLREEFGVSVSIQTLSREVRAMSSSPVKNVISARGELR